jgi:hypothetical protein
MNSLVAASGRACPMNAFGGFVVILELSAADDRRLRSPALRVAKDFLVSVR